MLGVKNGARALKRPAYRALVLDQHSDAMRTVFRELLHDLGEVNCKEKVSPRELRKHVDFLVCRCSIWQDCGSRHSAPWRANHVIFHSARLTVPRKVEEAVSEEANNKSFNTLREPGGIKHTYYQESPLWRPL